MPPYLLLHGVTDYSGESMAAENDDGTALVQATAVEQDSMGSRVRLATCARWRHLCTNLYNSSAILHRKY
jgi:hypothetical protein